MQVSTINWVCQKIKVKRSFQIFQLTEESGVLDVGFYIFNNESWRSDNFG